MKVFAASAFAAALGLLSAAPSLAMTMAPAQNANSSNIVRVAQGCGPGMHRGPGGHCRPLYSCPRGWHPGPKGYRCFRN